MSDDEDIIKVFEVELLDDQGEFEKTKWNPQLSAMLTDIKKKCLRLLEMHASLSKSQSKLLMN